MSSRIAVAMALVTSGCAVKPVAPLTWRMNGRLVAPPGVAAEAPSNSFKTTTAKKGCPPNDAISVVGKKVTVNREALIKAPRGAVTAWAEAAEASGCIPASSGSALATRIVESVAMPTGSDLRLLRVDGMPNFVEIGPGMRLQAVSPIMRTGGNANAVMETLSVTGTGGQLNVELKSSPDLIGFETAWYDIRPKKTGGGFQIVPVSAETSIRGQVEAQAAPAKNLFAFAPGMGFYRLFYKADQSEVVAAAPRRTELPENPDICNAPAVCLAIPRGVGVNPYMAVEVNGKAVTVSTGTDLRNLLRQLRLTAEQVLPTLAITRQWGGKAVVLEFDRTKQDVLGLILTGKESLRW